LNPFCEALNPHDPVPLHDERSPNLEAMGVLTVTQARENLAELIESTHRDGEPLVLTQSGRPVAVMLDHAVFERLREAAHEALLGAPRSLGETELGLA
jgi:prevent-host-death family protein